jgi:hypothetical protein
MPTGLGRGFSLHHLAAAKAIARQSILSMAMAQSRKFERQAHSETVLIFSQRLRASQNARRTTL